MKIAYIIPSLVNKGPIIVVDTIVRNLIDKVDKIDVYYFDDIEGVNFVCPTHKIDFNTPIDFDEYDIVHSHMFRPDKYICKWRKKIKKAKLISTIHQDIFQNLKFSYNVPVAILFTYLWKRYLKKMDGVVVISRKLLDLYSRSIPQSAIVYNGVDIEYNPNIADKGVCHQIEELHKRGFKIVGTYAAINKRKGIDQLFALLAIRSDIALVIIGQGEEKDRLEKLTIKQGLGARVLFFPYLNHPYNYLENIDVYAMPSRSEGFGLSVAEAALTRTPIVCSNIDVFKEIFEDSQVSFFEIENIPSLSHAVDVAMSASDNKIENAYNRIQSNFTGEIMAINYLKLYNSILNDNSIDCNI